MKRSLVSWTVAAVIGVAWIGSAGYLRSQERPEPASAVERLEELKAANAALLDQQQKTLQKLDELQEQASQLRIMAKRT